MSFQYVASERTRNPYWPYKRRQGRTLSVSFIRFALSRCVQYPVAAGHEFTLSTDPKYNEICDSEVMWVDYVCDAC